MAATPHLFGQRPALHTKPYLIIPRVSSELREFYPVRRVEPHVIASDATFTARDPSGLLFAIISSSMFMTWQATVGGRLESRLRFSNTIVWNNLPLPDIDQRTRENIITAGHDVELARAEHPTATLAQLYRTETMPTNLRLAHDRLDRLIDTAFGASDQPTLAERQRVLFKRYEELTAPLLAERSSARRGKR
jgi:hypothetical protein